LSRIFTSGFESGISGATTATADTPLGGGGTVTRDTTVQRTGTGCAKCDSTGSNINSFVSVATLVASTTFYSRAYIRLPALPATDARIFGESSGGFTFSVVLTTGGKLQLWNDLTGTQIGSDSAATIAINTYYRVEVRVVVNASTQATDLELRLDGATVATVSGLTTSVSGALILGFGWTPGAKVPGANKIIYLDDVAVNTGAGSVNNTWCGAGAVIMLLPTADSAVGTNWTRGNGTVISGGNGFQSVDNVPPVGIADLGGAGADTGQLRNAGSNANSNYDATMQTYTAGGVPTGATINAVIPWAVTGAPVVTAAKLGTLGVVSNPIIANVNLGPGGTSGAFWSGGAAGTWPTGWKASPGTVTEAPSVTLGTAPVMRVTQVTSSTRIAIVCFMGMYVDFTPLGTTYTKAGFAKEGA